MGIDAIVGLVSLFGPKIIDTVKGWIHRKDSPEGTMAVLANTNPAELSNYVKAQAELMRVQNEAVNSDVTGTVSEWVSDVRAMIRPIITVTAIGHIIYASVTHTVIDPEFRYTYEAAIGSWFGSRLK